MIVSQLASLDAVQLQPVNTSRLTVNPPPAKPTESLERFHAYRQGAADWPSSTVWPPTSIVAERAAGAGFAATVYGIWASPCPFVAASVTQLALAVADQVQSRVAVTATVPWPPAAGNIGAEAVAATWHFWEVGDTIAVEVSVDVQANAPSAVATTTM